MAVFPASAAAISAVFAVLVLRRYAQRRRLPHLAWGLSLVMFAIASATVAAGVSGGWDPTLYRAFWLFGAMLNVPWLAVGSIALVSRPLIGRIAAALTLALSVFGLVAVAQASPDVSALAASSGIPRGKDVWGSDVVLTLARWYSIVGWLLVVIIAVLSSRARGGVRPPADRVRGNVLIAIGVTIVAIGGFALGRIGRGEAFSISLLLGVGVMFAGFLSASRAPRFRVEDPGESPT